ncbi:hemerythrin domain-containing protein [Streptomyces sp. NPDC049555]|uniref:hemerythrin domain-containing protein n=1 Tax=unclassified Streptomyces TaxID=2593676 RepID=UPI00343E546E
MSHGGNVIEELTTDHREVESLFQRIQSLPAEDPQRRSLADQLTIELVRHSVAEEEYLYPAVRAHVDDGAALAEKEISDHARVERLLKDLESARPGEHAFEATLEQLREEVLQHVADEESRLFTLLQQACSAEQLDKLGDKIRRAKKTAPTRPHPSAPDRPPANKLLAPGAGLVDRARDLISGRGR